MNIRIAAIEFTLLFVTAVQPCFALMGISYITRDQAKELGIEIRVQPNGPREVWIEMEFKIQGRLKDFDHVSLEIREGDKLLIGYASLREERSATGTAKVHFMANRAFLDKVTLSIVTGFPSNYSGNELRLKDFVELPR
jgi:hypothetical protein